VWLGGFPGPSASADLRDQDIERNPIVPTTGITHLHSHGRSVHCAPLLTRVSNGAG
jgi:hypothetical protein